MTVEELLKPRWKVIADYPKSQFKVGEIIESKTGFLYCFEDYPHLFQPLQWWEERKLEDMPEYVNYNGGIYKVESPLTIIDGYIYTEGAVIECQLKLSLPATISEYESYKQKQ